MGKEKSVYVCNECGFESPKWQGKCPSCNAWNTFEERLNVSTRSSNSQKSFLRVSPQRLSDISSDGEKRIKTKIGELDRVLGSGIVVGSVVLLCGDPGIGKSTILLQLSQSVDSSLKILYVSGEESASQIKMRADRLGVNSQNLFILAETDTESVCDYVLTEKPDIVIIDSIQTMQIAGIQSSPGSIVQVRESTNLFFRTAKENAISFFIVGHVNKGGDIAGPKILEHIVDTVLYFEGERNHSYRILRATKNRFGSTNEIGVFEMSESGLNEVENPSAVLLSGRAENVSGDCITCIMEGTRPILTEIQCLAAKNGYTNPRRMASGYDFNRLCMMIAVLEKRNGLFFSNLDTYLNIIGGLRIDEPAADLAVILALVSAVIDKPIDSKTIVFGEVGLSGEVRSVSRITSRVSEAERLGFETCVLPKSCLRNIDKSKFGMNIIGVSNIKQAIALIK